MEFDIIYPENKADAFDAECGKTQKTMRARVKPTKTWISKSKFEIENEDGDELPACFACYLSNSRFSHTIITGSGVASCRFSNFYKFLI